MKFMCVSVMLWGVLSAGAFAADNVTVFFEETFGDELDADSSSAYLLGADEAETKQLLSNSDWGWGSDFDNDPSTGVRYGEGDIYDISTTESYSDGVSLRMNFAGRNGYCNICGGNEYTIDYVDSTSACFNYDGSAHEAYVFNKSNDFSKWAISSDSNNRICINTSTGLIAGGIYDSADTVADGFAVGDAIQLPNLCGTNGSVGGNINRRSDCNLNINYLDNVSSDDLGYGESISRRFYLYIPSDTVLPGTTLKLGYSYWQRYGASQRSSTIKVSVQRGGTMELSMPGGSKYAQSASSDVFKIVRDQWMYFEEVFTRESSQGATDASYEVYASVVGDYDPEPIATESGFELGALKKMSIAGNWQHNNDVSGYAYFDNILISDTKAGPVIKPVLGTPGPSVVIE